MCLQLLVEGSSVRAVERITGTHRDTICRLLRLVGDKAERFLAETVSGVPVSDVELDEVWSYSGCKAGTLRAKGLTDPTRGDIWSFLAVERHSKMILAHKTGDRDTPTCYEFIERLDGAADGHFQLTVDGWSGYPDIVVEQLGTRVDAAQLIKEFGQAPEEERRKYSPPKIIASEKKPFHGRPARDRICTSIVERCNLSVRTFTRRMTRLTCAFSKSKANHAAAISLFVAWFNFVRIHRSIRCTPAMAAGVTAKLWTMADLVAAL